jgi:serine/threonine-protein kinase
MSNALLDRGVIHEPPHQYLRSVGTVFAEFGERTQDSGNVSYGVAVAGNRYFVKTPGRPDDPRPVLDHPARVALLRNAARLYASCPHPLLPRLYRVVESPSGPLLVYQWLDGELLGVPRARRGDPESALQRFRSLPASAVRRCLDAVFDLHDDLARAGWVAVDFYDGCLIYEFASGRLGVVDLDHYRAGPSRNERGRMFGSERFMAPEEFELGARIDERTTVFVLGRTALVFLSDGTLTPGAFRGSPALFEVVARACDPDPTRRFGSVGLFCHAWHNAEPAGPDVAADRGGPGG